MRNRSRKTWTETKREEIERERRERERQTDESRKNRVCLLKGHPNWVVLVLDLFFFPEAVERQ